MHAYVKFGVDYKIIMNDDVEITGKFPRCVYYITDFYK